MTTVHLNSDFRRLLAKLAVPEGTKNATGSISPEEQRILVRDLERALVDPPYMVAYLETVRPLAHPSATDLDLLADEQVEQVIANGLSVLSPEQVQQLAFDLPA